VRVLEQRGQIKDLPFDKNALNFRNIVETEMTPVRRKDY